MFKLLSIVALAMSAVNAYQVTSPNGSQGWVSTGSNRLAWNRVSTDPTTFNVVLTNQDGSVYARSSQTLATGVDGTAGSVTIDTTNIPPGPHYRVNLNAPNGQIYAQSNEFTVTRSGSGTVTPGTTSTGVVTETSTSFITFTETAPIETTTDTVDTTTVSDTDAITTSTTLTETESVTTTTVVETDTETTTSTSTTIFFTLVPSARKVRRDEDATSWF